MKHIVGIDLGFSNTICSYSDNGSVKQLVFETSAILPSYIYEIYNFSNNTLNPKLKNNIREFSANYDKHLIFGSKKLLGRDFNHPNVKNFVYSHKNQMDIVNKNGKPTYKLIFQNGDISKEIYLSPDDVSAQILSYVSETYRSKFGHAIYSCVVTVPAKFDSNQRRDTISAIEKSGIKCLKLINEPTAAAFSYFSEHQTNNQKILIFDYGAGTLDVSIVEIKGKEFEVLYTEGNSDLGGHDLDLILYEDVLNTFKSKNKDITTIPDRSARILMLEVEQAKIKLSAESKATITIEDFASGYDLKVNIFRNHYEELISDEIEKSRKVLFNAIRGSKVEPETISAIFPIGGTCRTPLVQKMLNEFFNNTPKYDKYYLDFKGKVKIVNELSYEYSVSIGACKLAKILDSGDKIIDRIHYDKLANNVGIMLKDGTAWWAFSSGTKFPLEQSIRVMNNPWEASKVVEIIEGSKGDPNFSRIQKVSIPNIPKKATELNLILKYNESGLLNVTCTDLRSAYVVSADVTSTYQPDIPEINHSSQRNDAHHGEETGRSDFDKRLRDLLTAVERAKNKAANQQPYKKLIRDINVLKAEADENFDDEVCTEKLQSLEDTFHNM